MDYNKLNVLKLEKKLFIHGPYSAVGAQKITNKDIIKFTNSDSSPAAVAFSTGIKTRNWVNENQACSDLAIEAVNKLFAAKKVDQAAISQLILTTISGDYISPPTAPLIQHQLNLQGIGAFDIAAACAGFVVGLHTACAFGQSMAGQVLLVASDIRSKFLNPNDFATSVLFGDAAAACTICNLEDGADFRVIASGIYSDGEVGDLVSIPAGGSRLPAAINQEEDNNFISVKENSSLFLKAVEGMVTTAEKFFDKLQINIDDIDHLIPHQGNVHLIKAVAKQLNIPEQRLINIVDETGNTSGASVGLALEALKQKTSLHKNDKILLVAAGGGGVAGCALLEAC